jgi:WD40 repeat protein
MKLLLEICATIVSLVWLTASSTAAPPDYARDVAPIFAKYCTTCHAGDEPEGKLVLESHAAAMKGGEHGAAIVPGKSGESRMIRMLTGELKPMMPPEDNERPTPAEIAILKAWIDTGAKGPASDAPPPGPITPKIKPKVNVAKITAVATSPDGSLVAIARHGEVEIVAAKDRARVRVLSGHRGSVNAVNFSRDGKQLITAAGEPGLAGEARLWNVADGALVRTFASHRDSVYAACLSPDGKSVATGGYDQKIILWDTATGRIRHIIAGHNGAVLDLEFSPDGKLLASASGDRTVKLWDVASGQRLDTLGQPLKDVYTVAFSPDGRQLAAAGVDRRIRVWAITQGGKEGTNPLVHARLAHDGAILKLVWSRDGRSLISAADNQTLSVWDPEPMALRQALPTQPDWTTGLSLLPDGKTLIVGRLNGTTETYSIAAPRTHDAVAELDAAAGHAASGEPAKPAELAETEPNDSPQQATASMAPVVISGKIQPAAGTKTDADIFRFDAKSSDEWIIETNAAKSGSPLDTKIEVLHADGKPVVRALLQATRDSAVTFRGADSNQLGFRIANWEEMELNQYLYIGGEVCRLFRFPQGPDSDFLFYGSSGRRRGYFDTTPVTHYLDEPCYIVRPYPPSAKFESTGLPVFPLYYSNDDDGLRKRGTDSHLTFTPPGDGSYLVRVTDSRGFAGEKFTYKLTIRRPRPDFTASVTAKDATIGAGSGKRFTIGVERIDGFDDDVRIEVANVPPGLVVTTPLVVEAGHNEAHGVIYAPPGAAAPTKEQSEKIALSATAKFGGKEVIRPLKNFGEIKVAARPKVLVHLELNSQDKSTAAAQPTAQAHFKPAELTIAPGTMVSAKLRIERHGFDGQVTFQVPNLPHGVIVDDIGLNGILLLAGQNERQIFLTARPWVAGQTRPFFAIAEVEGNQASLPILLKVSRNAPVAATTGGQ